MPHPFKRSIANQVLVELVEADVETGFSLVDVADSESGRDDPAFSAQVLHQAEAIVSDITRRLAQLGPEESAPFHSLVEELRRESRLPALDRFHLSP